MAGWKNLCSASLKTDRLIWPCLAGERGPDGRGKWPYAIGCGSKDEGSSGGSSDGTKLDVIISQYGNYTKEWWTEFEKTFEEQNEGIDLNIEIVSWNDIYSVVNTRISTNEQPDILNISGFADY